MDSNDEIGFVNEAMVDASERLEEAIELREVGKLKNTLSNVNKLVEDFLLLERIDEGVLNLDYGVIQSRQLVADAVSTIEPLLSTKELTLEQNVFWFTIPFEA